MRPANTRTFGLSSIGTPLVNTSQVSVAPAEPQQQHELRHDHLHDIPMDVDNDFDLIEPPDLDNHNVDEEVPPLPETIAPGLNLRGIQKAKQYENSVS